MGASGLAPLLSHVDFKSISINDYLDQVFFENDTLIQNLGNLTYHGGKKGYAFVVSDRLFNNESLKMSSIVLKSLSILLGLFFIFVGTMKVTSLISKDLHKDLRKEYVKYAKVFPLTQLLDIKMPPKWYRRFIGSAEIICGLALALAPNNKIKQGANIVLLFLMLMAVYSHYMVNDKFERIAPALVFFFMLTGRLVIDYQLKKKMEAVTGNGDVPTEEKVRKGE